MASINFFSVERKGYTKVSDLFYDVMQDMLEHGFTFINCSNALKDRPLTYWDPTIVSSTSGKAVGDKFYILDGTRQTYAGTPRPAPYVQVTSVTSSAGNATRLSNVISSYDFPIWTEDGEPTANIKLSADPDTFVDSGIEITIANVTARSDRSTSTANVSYAPSNFSFTLEASGNVDPLNGEYDPNGLSGTLLPDSSKQPWRVQFVISDDQKASAAVATKLQMYYDEVAGRVKISQITNDYGRVIDNVGVTGAQQVDGIFSDEDLNQGIYNRKVRVSDYPQTYPLSYVLSISNRGFFLGIYEGSWSTIRAASSPNSNYFNWILVQRPVDRGTGRALTNGKAPVFHINSVNYKYYKSVVREADVLHPTVGPLPEPPRKATAWIKIDDTAIQSTTAKDSNGNDMWVITGVPNTDFTPSITSTFLSEIQPGTKIYLSDNPDTLIGTVAKVLSNTNIVLANRPNITSKIDNVDFYYLAPLPPTARPLRTPADMHSPDSHAIFNSVEQVSLTEDKTYLLSFPHNLTTPRYRYTEELDMIGTTSSDVVMSGQDIQFKTYGEVGPRTYRALPANGPLNTGLRIAVLWAPQGPKWVNPNGEISPTDLGPITQGSSVGIALQADPVPVAPGEDPRALPSFRLERGALPSGLFLVDQSGNWVITGTVDRADYIENTVIKFTIAAVNQEDTGYSLKDFFFTYIV